MEYKSQQLTKDDIELDGTFSGYGSVFDVIHPSSNFQFDQDVLHPGAFTDSLKAIEKAERHVKMLYRHQEALGVYDEVKEDSVGLFVKGKPDDTTLGRDVIEHMRSRVIDGLSIGFDPVKWDVEETDNGTLRHLNKVDLGEVSPVIWGANPAALINEVKQQFNLHEITTVRGFEKFLREVGYSHAQAKAIASNGFEQYMESRNRDDSDDNNAALLGGLQELTSIFNQ